MNLATRYLGALAGLLAAAAAFGSLPARAAGGDDLRLECEAEGPNDISMHARYEERDNGRRRFGTEFEAAPGGDFSPWQRMAISVEGVKVGSVRLQTLPGGDVGGDLDLGDDSGKPLPDNFPALGRGSPVRVRIDGERVLACRLR
jgi:hypothetical protein